MWQHDIYMKEETRNTIFNILGGVLVLTIIVGFIYGLVQMKRSDNQSWENHKIETVECIELLKDKVSSEKVYELCI